MAKGSKGVRCSSPSAQEEVQATGVGPFPSLPYVGMRGPKRYSLSAILVLHGVSFLVILVIILL